MASCRAIKGHSATWTLNKRTSIIARMAPGSRISRKASTSCDQTATQPRQFWARGRIPDCVFIDTRPVAASSSFIQLRIRGLVLSDLIAKKRMHRVEDAGIFRVYPHGATLRQIFIAVRDLQPALLHLRYARRHLTVCLEGFVELSPSEIGGNGPQVGANRRDRGVVLFVLDGDLD